jgi:hypothetical protein
MQNQKEKRKNKNTFVKVPPLIKGARGILKITLTSLITTLTCVGIVYAATTIGPNITTTGALSVAGAPP